MKTRTIIYAEEGKVLTNGEIYGKEIYLAEGESAGSFYEISEAEYDELMKNETSETM